MKKHNKEKTATPEHKNYFWIIIKSILYVIGVAVAIFVIMVLYFLFFSCHDKTCFIKSANDCSTQHFDSKEDVGSIEYASGSYNSTHCWFTKEFVSFSSNEDQELVNLLKDKNMVCYYKKGNFDPDWVNTWLFGLNSCQGELKDSIGSLVVLTE